MAGQKLEDFNVEDKEIVIIEGDTARTAILAEAETGGNYSQLTKFVKLTNTKVVDASRGENLAKYIESKINGADRWFTAMSKLPEINVVDASGAKVDLKGELASRQTIKIAYKAYANKNRNGAINSGLQAVLIPDAATIRYYEGGNSGQATAALFGLDSVQPAAQPAQPAAPAQAAPAPEVNNPFASAQPAAPAPEVDNPFGANPFGN